MSYKYSLSYWTGQTVQVTNVSSNTFGGTIPLIKDKLLTLDHEEDGWQVLIRHGLGQTLLEQSPINQILRNLIVAKKRFIDHCDLTNMIIQRNTLGYRFS